MASISNLARAIVALALIALIAAPAAGAAAKPKKPAKPLVYILSLDGLDRDAIEKENKGEFLADLASDRDGAHGAFFGNSSSVMVAETNPNHSSMITGAYPERHGIVGNAFATPGAGTDEDSCPASPGGPPAVTSGESPSCLRAETAFTALERQSDRRYTTALIMGKDKLARLFSTQAVNPGTYDADHIWAPCDDPAPYCDPDVPTNPISGYAADDAVVMDELIRTTREGVEDAGRMRRPNLSFVNFPAIDTAGHTFGRTNAAYGDAVDAAAAQIDRFVANQKELGIWRRTVMIIVSDHAMDDTPQLAKVSLQQVLTAGGIPPDAYEIVGNGSAAHIYLTERNAAGAPELLAQMRSALTSAPGVDQALYRAPNPADGGDANAIATAAPSWHLGGVNTGDIVVSTRPGVAVLEASSVAALPFNPLQGNHGSTFTRDNFWLIAGGGKLIRDANPKLAVTNANAAPTALRLLGAKPPADAQTGVAKTAFRKKLLRRLSPRR